MPTKPIKTAVIYNANSPICAPIAKSLTAQGINIAIVDPDLGRAGAVASDANALAVAGDLTDNSSAAGLAYDLADQLGDIDLFITLSQIRPRKGMAVSFSHYNAIAQQQLTPLFMTARHFVPGMSAPGGGTIIHLSNAATDGDTWARAAETFAQQVMTDFASDPIANGVSFHHVPFQTDDSAVQSVAAILRTQTETPTHA